ncbi:site-2 protease family protein [Paenibacillus protaetiae]|uniref:Site-2 protease family protein n=1 Tax=Paenibacillus protaetiae TaxID=2509456 RepID=A0A4P6EX54_9BACL|nr:site-2 protease family protein [Paenibacillus protaetiae]QAY66319.1 site-2 protease family protein [Paenibacillus protaetiae]
MNLDGFFRYPVDELPFVVLTILIAFTVHEFSHAYFAYKFGDRTAYDAGRVTLNPRVHLDILGTILILIAGFGWAKPVPVNPSRFKYPRLMGIVVSAAGPISNLLIGAVGMFIYYVLLRNGVLMDGSRGVIMAVHTFFGYLISINLLLFVFNLIPLPPLDGYRIIADLLPLRLRYKLDQNAQWGSLIFLILVFVPALRRVTLDPILNLSGDIFLWLDSLYRSIL